MLHYSLLFLRNEICEVFEIMTIIYEKLNTKVDEIEGTSVIKVK